MRLIQQLIVGLLVVTSVAMSTQAASVQGRFYSVQLETFEDGEGEDIYRHLPGFHVSDPGSDASDPLIVEWGVFEYEITQEVVDKQMRAYFYLPRIGYDELAGSEIRLHITNVSPLSLEEIARQSGMQSGMVLAATIDGEEDHRRYQTPDCINNGITPFRRNHLFTACHFRPIELDFFNVRYNRDFQVGDTLTIVVSLFVPRSGGGSDTIAFTDLYGFFAAGVRLSDQPLQPMASGDDVERCDGKTPTILGTHNADTIYIPSDRNHVVLGLRGDDDIIGSRRRDTVCSGDNNDMIRGNDGNDYLHGGSHSDMILAGQGNDRLVDTSGHNVLIGSGGRDHITGSATSTCIGNGGRDSVNARCGVKHEIEVVR